MKTDEKSFFVSTVKSSAVYLGIAAVLFAVGYLGVHFRGDLVEGYYYIRGAFDSLTM